MVGDKHTIMLVKHVPGGGTEFLAAVVPEATYNAIFDFYGVVERTAFETFPGALAESLPDVSSA